MYYKFPSTPYIETNACKVRDDKILDKNEVNEILSKEITVEEKIDGANLGISFDHEGSLLLQNRGAYLIPPLEGQWKPLEQWVAQRENQIFDCISDAYILFGEWCYIKHSVFYDALPDWFIAFDVYDKRENRFLSVEVRDQMIEAMGLAKVPCLGYGKYSLGDLKGLIRQSKFSQEMCEGIYLRQDDGRFLCHRAKMVRDDFKQNMTVHWSKNNMERNRLSDRFYCGGQTG